LCTNIQGEVVVTLVAFKKGILVKHKGVIGGLGWPCSSNNQVTNVSIMLGQNFYNK
jgi:hypothetical protein